MVFQVFLQDAAPQLHAEPLGNTLQLMGHVREIATSRELLVLQLFKQAYMWSTFTSGNFLYKNDCEGWELTN